jgi:twitching motility protein PilT
MEMKDYLLKALDSEATEIVFAPGESARFRREKDWMSFESFELAKPVSPAVTRLWAFQLCSDEAKKTLLDQGSVQGFWEMHSQKLFYEIHASDEGFLIQAQWLPQEWRETDFWNFPKWTQESIWRGRGLHLLVSPTPAVLEAAAVSLLSAVNVEKKSWIVWVKSQCLAHMKSESSLITYHQKVPSACDVVIFDGFDRLAEALEESEKGRAVVLMLRHHSFFQALTRAMGTVGNERFSAQLKMAFNLRVIYGTSGWVPAYDLLANTTSVEESLNRNDLSGLQRLMKESEKETGMRTLNQSLLQLMIKRKIDFKKGFELSPAPQELDALLKQIGI